MAYEAQEQRIADQLDTQHAFETERDHLAEEYATGRMIGQLLEQMPECVDLEGMFEQGCDDTPYDTATLLSHAEDFSPRLKAARLARQKKWGA